MYHNLKGRCSPKASLLTYLLVVRLNLSFYLWFVALAHGVMALAC